MLRIIPEVTGNCIPFIRTPEPSTITVLEVAYVIKQSVSLTLVASQHNL